ncbi:MAG: Gfo/Idh/MocA family oxidoreductase, partial [Lentisphaeria bacterium]|nr:Gfo/Idh/MocA family oxidoreductase [Lentisphaeria bacterium]
MLRSGIPFRGTDVVDSQEETDNMGKLAKLEGNVSRRRVLCGMAGSAAALAVPTILPFRVLGEEAPSKRLAIGMIGMGRQAFHSNLPAFLHSREARVVAVCDADRWRLDNAKRKVDEFYKNTDCRAYTDWRELLARDDIDAIMNST